MRSLNCDVLVIGAGLAGLYAALGAAQRHRVILLTKTSLSQTNSAWAQGGIAAAVEEHDSPRLHLEDTLTAGRGLCNLPAVEVLVSEGPDCVRDLERLGVAFDRAGQDYLLGREGGHSRRRIVHAGGSSTGKKIVETLSRLVLETPNIQLVEETRVVELLVREGRCAGARCAQDRTEIVLRAWATILATGGAAALYARTTNPPGATGDGIALAYRAGAELMDLEFVQFHPTALALPNICGFLITEAVRGEGAHLLNTTGERFMLQYNERAELAPRDVVSRAIFQEMRRLQADRVFLDLRHLKPDLVRGRFANIYEMLQQYDLDATRDLIPVAPAAHYTVGGVRTDLNAETTVKNLYAVGEVSCTGVHGANRLASNSLLECLVFAQRAVKSIYQSCQRIDNELTNEFADALSLVATELGEELTQLMSRYVGLVRDRAGLEHAIQRLSELEREPSLSPRALVARLIAQSALWRTESRGVHIRSDYLEESPDWLAHIIVQKDRGPRFEKLDVSRAISVGRSA